ncbi:hypothetical protein [sulfur-oxidizing endosymbiont of Gigantopelta aegis]|uniref:hypothetical protein n=1 Tax=sulfur-oxidizing endosymbiont of Gigantopelta aegis TaxID=2794934 RepID=UPI0018DD9E96|nr:hypothetical protein [sulfur-oxidizing endosymbiont of Gigantopelta aegis]
MEKIAIIYSFATLFIIELLYQTLKALYRGTRYSFKTLQNSLIAAFFELFSDMIMLLIDFIQALIEGISIGWKKALNTSNEFKHDAHF